MNSVLSAIENTISISLFNRGLAGKIFMDVRKKGAKVVIKNNTPECVLLSPEEYVKMVDEINDLRLLVLANERLKNFDSKDTISWQDMKKELNISDSDLINSEEIELE